MRGSFKETSGLSNINGVEFQNGHCERAYIYFNKVIFQSIYNFYIMIEFTGRKSSLLEENSCFTVTSFF